jgi:hypothetical protein
LSCRWPGVGNIAYLGLLRWCNICLHAEFYKEEEEEEEEVNCIYKDVDITWFN